MKRVLLVYEECPDLYRALRDALAANATVIREPFAPRVVTVPAPTEIKVWNAAVDARRKAKRQG